MLTFIENATNNRNKAQIYNSFIISNKVLMKNQNTKTWNLFTSNELTKRENEKLQWMERGRAHSMLGRKNESSGYVLSNHL